MNVSGNETGPSMNTLILQAHFLNWSLQPFIQDYKQASHITHVVDWINFIQERWHLHVKVESEIRILFEKPFNTI